MPSSCRYRAETDPWRLTDAEPSPPREYLWRFYNTTAQYLAQQARLRCWSLLTHREHMHSARRMPVNELPLGALAWQATPIHWR